MGARASSQITRSSGGAGGGAMMVKWSTTAKLIHIDGRLQEFSQPIKANDVLSLNPNTFLCNSENMYVNAHVPHVAGDEDLQPGQIYFLLPASKSQTPLSLQDLCGLAVKAGIALKLFNTTSCYDERRVGVRRGHVNNKKMGGVVGFRLGSKKLG